MSVQNQKIIIINKSTTSKYSPYATYNLKDMQKAMAELKGETFKLWAYLGKNQNNYRLELSIKDAEQWGLKKDAYYRGVDTLIEKGYLVSRGNKSNVYVFYEGGAQNDAKPTVEVEMNADETVPEISESRGVSQRVETQNSGGPDTKNVKAITYQGFTF